MMFTCMNIVKVSEFNFEFLLNVIWKKKNRETDIRQAELVIGRSINLALSARGRKALREVGLEDDLLQHGIPMRGRMLHDLKGRTKCIPYDVNTNQCIYSVGRKHLNEVLLNGNCYFFLFFKILSNYNFLFLSRWKEI